MPALPLLALIAWFVDDAGATRAPVSRGALCAEADAVVVAEVTTTEGRWRVGQLGGIETLVSVAVTEQLRGRAPASLSFVVPGGVVGGLRQTISEAPDLRTDARYLLFLAREGSGWRLVGGADGVEPIPWAVGELERASARAGGCGA